MVMNSFLVDANIATLQTRLELLQKKATLLDQLQSLESAASPGVTAMMATSEQAASTAPVALQPWAEWGGAVVDWAGSCVGLLSTEVQQQASGLVPPAALDALYTVQFMQSTVLAALSDVLHAPILGEMTTTGLVLQLGVIAAFGLGGLVFSADGGKESQAPYEAGTSTYDPKVADAFYRERPLLVARRIITLARLNSAFTTGLLFDWLVLGKLFKDEEYTALKNAEPRRAKEALVLCEQLGTTFIKLGQALSIREDLIPTAYALELRQLQDAVPPFSSEEAFGVLREQLGVKDLSEVFSSLSATPIASASIGQVYKGTLKGGNGTAVAVKVQRPGILAEIALDLHVLRLATPFQTRLSNAINGLATDPADIEVALQLVDEWGRGFVAETDYRLEAKNTIDFSMYMQKRGLDAVCAPTVVTEMVRDRVLVTEWVEGTRLDRDASPDVPRLCGVAINAYLTMLLDTGVLHCDPHPGNLLRTTDGRLCILDWGMTLDVPQDLQYALLEFIAHINTENYGEIPQDFVNLGFAPEGVTAEKLEASGITEGVAFAFRQLSAGGGPAKIGERVQAEFKERYGAELSDRELEKAAQAEMVQRMEAQLESEGIDVKGVSNVMEEMSRRNRELFQLPPYMLYVARAFSTLEGIGLGVDEDYSIVQECYPYLARRLFTDRAPRAKTALRAMLGLEGGPGGIVAPGDGVVVPTSPAAYGQAAPPAPAAAPGGTLNAAKLFEMSEGFSSYSDSTSAVEVDTAGQGAAAKEMANLLLSREGSTLQDILVEESTRLGDAAVRSALRRALIDDMPLAAAAAAAGLSPPAALVQLLAPTAEDERVLGAARELGDLLGPRVRDAAVASPSAAASGPLPRPPPVVAEALEALRTSADARDDAARQLDGLAVLSRRIGAGLLRRAADRADDVPILPGAARGALISGPRSLADAIEPAAPPSEL